MKHIVQAAVCLLAFAVAPAPARGGDLFNAVVLENGDLFVEHLNSLHNCCVDLAHEVEFPGILSIDHEILIREVEPGGPGCDCVCWFDVDLVIHDLPPATYTLHYTWDTDPDLAVEVWATETLTVEKPQPNLLPVEPTTETFLSECHDGDSVPADGVAFDRLKAWYR